MVRVFCIVNQKGGVGKTTTAISLAGCFAKSAAKTLVIDLDPQSNATTGLGFEASKSHPLVVGTPFVESVVQTQTPNLELLCGYRNFGDVEARTRNDAVETKRMKDQLEQEFQNYDFVLIDCPPSLGHLTQIALSASTEILIPIQCEFFAIEGFVFMVENIITKMMKQQQRLEDGRVLMTMYDASLELTHYHDSQLRKYFGEGVFKTVIPRDITISEAAGYGLPIIDYAPRSRGARAYIELCMEILNRSGEQSEP